VAGVTGSTEPDVTGVDNYGTVTDGAVTWVVRNTLVLYTGNIAECLDTFGVEIKSESGACGDGTPDDFYERFMGGYLNTLDFGLAAEDKSLSTSGEVLASNGDNNASNPSFVPVTGTDIDLTSPLFAPCDVEVYMNGTRAVSKSEARLNIANNVTIDPTINCETDSIAQEGKPQITGTINGLFDKALYEQIVNRETFEFKLVYDNKKGDKVEITVPLARFDRVPVTYETGKLVSLNCTFTAEGAVGTPAVSYECIADTHYN
jgi:hypothetical protein